MRPQHDAGENIDGAIFAKEFDLASMRPQHDAGENAENGQVKAKTIGASMRPQHDAGENRDLDGRGHVRVHASMRPQHDAGENCHCEKSFRGSDLRAGSRDLHGRQPSCHKTQGSEHLMIRGNLLIFKELHAASALQIGRHHLSARDAAAADFTRSRTSARSECTPFLGSRSEASHFPRLRHQ